MNASPPRTVVLSRRLRWSAAVAVLFLSVRALADETPIAPDEAQKHVGEEVTVKMEVKASKKAAKRKLVFLDSKENFQDPDNLGITLNETAEADLARKHATADVAGFFKTKTIRVTGKVVRRDDRTYIDVERAEQIELVDPQ